MRAIKRLTLHVALFAAVLLASGCIANPTPHPGSSDNSGLNSLGAGGAMESASSADEANTNNALDEGYEDSEAGAAPSAGEEPNATMDATGSEGDAADTEDAQGEDAGPESDASTCEGVVEDFQQSLEGFQACSEDAQCLLLLDENSCACTRAIAVSDIEGAQALLDEALGCASEADEILGACDEDIAPLGNQAICVDERCQVLSPSTTCMAASGEDALDSEDAGAEQADVGPEGDTNEGEAD